jgi:hypothetical protein
MGNDGRHPEEVRFREGEAQQQPQRLGAQTRADPAGADAQPDVAVSVGPVDPLEHGLADQLFVPAVADGEVEQAAPFIHLLFDLFILLLDHPGGKRPHGLELHEAHEFGVVGPARFDLRMVLVVNGSEADVLSLEQLGL